MKHSLLFVVATTYIYIKPVAVSNGYLLTTVFSIGKLIHENLFFFSWEHTNLSWQKGFPLLHKELLSTAS